MQPANNFIVLNIREYLENEDKRLGEETLVQLLSEFSCPLNPDVERFLKEQAIDFVKKHQAVTYLVLSLEDAELLGYFCYCCSAEVGKEVACKVLGTIYSTWRHVS